MKTLRRILLIASAVVTLASTSAGVSAFATPINGATPRSACSIIPNRYGHSGAMLCGSKAVIIHWYSGLDEEVIIGSNYYVYHDFGNGWQYLSGQASHTLSPGTIGVGYYNGRISIYGTDNRQYCNVGNGDGTWQGWGSC